MMEYTEENPYIIIINYAYSKAKNCYNADCNDCPGLFITHTGNFESFKKYVQESLNFYIECAKQDGDILYWVFEDDIPYKLEFREYSKLN